MKIAIRVLTVCLVLTLGCGTTQAVDPAAPPRAESGGVWTPMPEAPLSPRRAAHAFTVNGTFYVMGGTEADPCPPAADCVEPKIGPRSDGAAFDPTTNEWRKIATAPAPLGYGSGVVIDDRIYLLLYEIGTRTRTAFLEYSTTEDAWTELPTVVAADWRSLVPFGKNVVAYQGSQENGIEKDYLYDVATGEWSPLPVDPLAATYDRSMVWTGEEIVLLGLPHVPNPGVKPSIYGAAALSEDHKWRRLPDSEIVGNNPIWHFAGGVVVNSSTVKIDGGETNNYGRFYPTGGIFDPATETWSDLPNPPEHDYEAFKEHVTGIYVGGEEMVTAGDGWAFHVPTGEWTALGRPDGGPESEMSAAWIGNRLAIWGGVSWNGSKGRLHNEGWIWDSSTR